MDHKTFRRSDLSRADYVVHHLELVELHGVFFDDSQYCQLPSFFFFFFFLIFHNNNFELLLFIYFYLQNIVV